MRSTFSWPSAAANCSSKALRASETASVSPFWMASPKSFNASLVALSDKDSPISSFEFALSTASSTAALASSIFSVRESMSLSSSKSSTSSSMISFISSLRSSSAWDSSNASLASLAISSVRSFKSVPSNSVLVGSSTIPKALATAGEKKEPANKAPATARIGMLRTASLNGTCFGFLNANFSLASSLCLLIRRDS